MSGAGSLPAIGRVIEYRAVEGETSGAAAGRRRVLRWAAPDLALVVASISFFYCLFLFQGYQKLFRDSDSGWHIRTGETIIATGALPHSDPYSFTRRGRPWFAWEWAADAAMGAAHRIAGLGGVALLYAAAIGAGVWCWFRVHWAVGGDFLLAAMMAAPLLTTCSLHWMARPHVFSWILMLLSLWWAERVASGGSPRLAAVALVSAAWSNIHASFPFAVVLCLVYCASHALRPLIWDFDRKPEWSAARNFLAAAAVAGAATLANPRGWDLHVHVWRYLSNGELLSRIAEFQTFNFHAEGSGQILFGMGIAALGGALALAARQPARFLLAAGLLALALRSARALPLVMLLLLPLANGQITAALRSARGMAPGARRLLDAFLDYSARLRRQDARLRGLALAPAVLAAGFLLLRVPAIAAATGFPPRDFPVAAAGEVARLPASARLLAPDKFGGYLIYRFRGERPVFFDGRSDFYGPEFLRDYARLAQVRPGWREILDGFGFTHALLPNDYSLIPALESAGWRRLYRDGAATLLEKEAVP